MMLAEHIVHIPQLELVSKVALVMICLIAKQNSYVQQSTESKVVLNGAQLTVNVL